MDGSIIIDFVRLNFFSSPAIPAFEAGKIVIIELKAVYVKP